jgi:integrase
MPYRKKNSPNWWISYTDATGLRVRCSSGTTEHALAKALEQRYRAHSFSARRKANGVGVSFDTILAEYLNQPGRLHKRSRSTARALAAFFGGHSIFDISRAAISGYIDHRRNLGIADSTIKRELTLWSAAVSEYNTRNGTELPNAASGVELREPEGRVRWITKDEAAKLIGVASPLVADFITVAIYTGMRTGELLTLEWSRINFERDHILLEAEHTKTRRRRIIPLHPEARTTLLRRRTRVGDSPYVFPSNCSATGHLDNLKNGFSGACKRAGVTNFRPHDLRHTCASWLVMAGVPLYEVRDILGHASIRTTERYAHLAPENLRAAVNALPTVLRSGISG